MAKQFLDATGLRHLWEKINNKFFPKEGNIIAPGNRSKIRLIPSSNTLNYNIAFRDLNDTVDLLNIGTNGHTGQNSSCGQIILSNKTQTSALKITSGGLSLTYNSSPTKVFATDGSVVDMNTYLPLSGGELTGNLYMVGRNQFQIIGIGGSIFLKDTENNMLAGVETMSDYSPVNDKSYGIIYCKTNDNSSSSTLSPGGLILTGNSGPVGEANEIYYSYSNITITMPDGTYRFNLQKLIDDGYLI